MMTKRLLILITAGILCFAPNAQAGIDMFGLKIVESWFEKHITTSGIGLVSIIIAANVITMLVFFGSKTFFSYLIQKKLLLLKYSHEKELETLKTSHTKDIEAYKEKLAEDLESTKCQNAKDMENYHKDSTKEIEKSKSCYETKRHISQAQFDAEFKMYQDILNSMLKMVKNVSYLYPLGLTPGNPPTRAEQIEMHKNAQSTLSAYQEMIFQYAPFLNEKMYDAFEKLLQLCSQQTRVYYFNFVINPRTEPVFEDDSFQRACQIKRFYEEITKQLRDYLSSLKIAEDIS